MSNDREIQDILKVIKLEHDDLTDLNNELKQNAKQTDLFIDDTVKFLKSRGVNASLENKNEESDKINNTLQTNSEFIESWDEVLERANKRNANQVVFEDILTTNEIQNALNDYEKIEKEFSAKTSIVNKTDLSFLLIATALQTIKALIFPYIANRFQYGNVIDKDSRLAHDDITITKEHREANDNFRDKHIDKYGKDAWLNIIYQTPPYDITKGSGNIGINMGGAYHRMHTLGHDPILGWIFGTANILTDTVTLNDFSTYRVHRNPIKIINETICRFELFYESYETVKKHRFNLAAAIFAQAQHLKSDEYTKIGLPIPILHTFDENFASELYKNGYDKLCLTRDLKIIGASAAVSTIIDMIIVLIHELFKSENENAKLYEARTRKILLVSNSIASGSTIINTILTKNPKKLDIGILLNTISHLFLDIRFICKLKQEFIDNEIYNEIQNEFDEIDKLYNEKFKN